MEAEQKLELQSGSSTKIRTDLNKANSDWKYNTVEGINLVHFCDRIYVPKTLRGRVIKLYHCYLQHPGGDRPAQILTTVCSWSVIVDQSRKPCITCKDFQKFKKKNSKYGLLPATDSETLTPWHTVCVDLIVTDTIQSKFRQPDNKKFTKELQLLCINFIDLSMGWFEMS